MSYELFKEGDTVELKSGGPVMTVTKVAGNHCICTWFEGSKVGAHSFPSSALRKPATGPEDFLGIAVVRDE